MSVPTGLRHAPLVQRMHANAPTVKLFPGLVVASHLHGTAERGLTELLSTDPQLDQVLRYRKYHLLNPNTSVNRALSSSNWILHRLLNHSLKDRKFIRANRIENLQFLAPFKRQCDENGVLEGAAMLLLPSYLETQRTAFCHTLTLKQTTLGGLIATHRPYNISCTHMPRRFTLTGLYRLRVHKATP